MTEEQIRVAAKYLGCECRYVFQGKPFVASLSLSVIQRVSWDSDCGLFQLLLKPLASLTEGDYCEMCAELSTDAEEVNVEDYNGIKNRWDMHFTEADWLRNNGYYLGEEPIKEFVKLK